jgi:hypothetical protein
LVAPRLGDSWRENLEVVHDPPNHSVTRSFPKKIQMMAAAEI